MEFADAVRAGWSKALDFRGRSSRSEFWWWTLFATLLSFGVAIIGHAIALPILSPLLALVMLIPNLSITFRRLHDIDKTHWWIAALIPIGLVAGLLASTLLGPLLLLATCVVLIIWFCKAGTVGENRYGPDPLASDPAPIEDAIN